MFPLSCPIQDLDQFVNGSKKIATGWLGFYWGKTIAEYKKETDNVAEGMALDWLEYFHKKTPEILMSSHPDKSQQFDC